MRLVYNKMTRILCVSFYESVFTCKRAISFVDSESSDLTSPNSRFHLYNGSAVFYVINFFLFIFLFEGTELLQVHIIEELLVLY